MENTASLTDFMPGGSHAPEPDSRPNLIGMDKADIIAEMEKIGEPKFRAQQIFQWIYNRGVIDFDDTIDGHDDGHGDDGENHRTVLTTAKFVAKGLEREHKRSQKLVELIEQNMAPAKELKSAYSLPYMY